MPIFMKPRTVRGHRVVFRNANADDASFILELRTDPKKGQFLSATPNDLELQREWLRRYVRDDEQIYFIIEDCSGEPYGTVRLYDFQGDSFCWGSWILKDGRPSGFAIESALMVYQFALTLGFTAAHFDVRKGNESVWQFHERFGAARVRESDEDYFYSITLSDIQKSLEKYKKYLPAGIVVTP